MGATASGKHLGSSMKLSTLSEKLQPSSSGTMSAVMVARIKCGRCGGAGTLMSTCGSCGGSGGYYHGEAGDFWCECHSCLGTARQTRQCSSCGGTGDSCE